MNDFWLVVIIAFIVAALTYLGSVAAERFKISQRGPYHGIQSLR